METRANYGLIGAFVLLAALAIVMFAVWISKVQFSKDFSIFDVVFEGAVNGLSDGSEVRYQGIKVGEVTQIELDDLNPNNVIARIRVAANTPVRADSKAELGILGITGLTFIQINAGSPDEPLLSKGIRPYPPRILAEKTQLDKLVASSGDLLASGTETLDQLSALFNEDNLDRMANILNNIEKMTSVANEDVGLIGEARQAIRALEQAGNTINEAAITVDKAALEFDGNVALMTNDTMILLKDMQGVVENANRAVVAAESVVVDDLSPQAEDVMQELAVTLQDVRHLINRLDGVVEDLERDPTTFVLGEAKPYE